MFFSSCLQNSKFWNSMCSSWNRRFCCVCGLWALRCQPEHPGLGLQRQNLSFQAVQGCTQIRVNLLNLVFLSQWKCEHDHNWRAQVGQAGRWVYPCFHQQSTLQHVTAAVTPRVGLNYVCSNYSITFPVSTMCSWKCLSCWEQGPIFACGLAASCCYSDLSCFLVKCVQCCWIFWKAALKCCPCSKSAYRYI